MEDSMEIERWECTECGGEKSPCRVEIFFEDGKYAPAKDHERFMKRVCICDNSPSPHWQKRSFFTYGGVCELCGIKNGHTDECPSRRRKQTLSKQPQTSH